MMRTPSNAHRCNRPGEAICFMISGCKDPACAEERLPSLRSPEGSCMGAFKLGGFQNLPLSIRPGTLYWRKSGSANGVLCLWRWAPP